MLQVVTGQLSRLDEEVAMLDKKIARRAREDEDARRLMTFPGVGPIAGTALLSLALPNEIFSKSRDLAARLGLTRTQLESKR